MTAAPETGRLDPARQRRLHAAILAVGGYWRPLAAVARLLEELGELAEALGDGSEGSDAVAAELADLWIITTCLANQYCVVLSPPDPESAADPDGLLTRLLGRAGEIARIVNYYDGPKNPRSLAGWLPLNRRIPEFHQVLHEIAAVRGLDLHRVVDDRIADTPARDAARFPRTGDDPSTAVAIETYRAATGDQRARLWGGPAWDPTRSVDLNVAALRGPLVSFDRCAPHEGIDGFVVALADPAADRLLATLDAPPTLAVDAVDGYLVFTPGRTTA